MTQTYEGGCHCGAVRYRAQADLSGVIECNCSHCSKKGFLLAFTPEADFELLSGGDAQTEYKFNKGQIAHLFCTTCGVQSFARGTGPDGAAMAALNVRCLDGVDISALTITLVDGKSF
jgi:hypothetical protein